MWVWLLTFWLGKGFTGWQNVNTLRDSLVYRVVAGQVWPKVIQGWINRNVSRNVSRNVLSCGILDRFKERRNRWKHCILKGFASTIPIISIIGREQVCYGGGAVICKGFLRSVVSPFPFANQPENHRFNRLKCCRRSNKKTPSNQKVGWLGW